MRLAVIVPALNEDAAIVPALARLAALRDRGVTVIVVDGGSRDDTALHARPLADSLLHSDRGRAQQMNVGAKAALDGGAEALVFLHADCILPDLSDRLIEAALLDGRHEWGRFDVRIEGEAPVLSVVSTLMNWRSRLTGICTGDQAIFVTRAAFEQLSGFAAIPLMEDIEFSKRARRISWPAAIAARVRTSGRRWQRHGVWRTIVLMWSFRLAYFLGADPHRLAQRYRDAR